MKHNLVGNKMPKLLRLVSNGPAHTSLKISMSTPSGNLFDPVVSRVVRRKVTHTLISRPKSIQNWTASLKKKNVAFSSYINEKPYYEELLFRDSFVLRISLAGYVMPSWARKDSTLAYVFVYECSFYRETFFLVVASSCSSKHTQHLEWWQ